MTDDPLDRPFPISSHESKRYGAITSFENTDGRTLVLHRAGRVRDAVAEACEIATGLDHRFAWSASVPRRLATATCKARAGRRGTGYIIGAHRRSTSPSFAVVGGKLRHMLHERLRGSGRDEWRDAPR